MIDFLLPWECIGPKEQYFLIHSRKDENQAHILAWKTLIMLQQWYKYAKCRNLQAGKMPTHWYQSDKYFKKLNIQRKRMKIYLTLGTPQPWSLITSPALWRCWQRCWWGSCCLDPAQGLSSLSYALCNGHQGFDKGHSMCLAIQSTRPGRSALFRLLSNSEGGAVFIVYFKPLSVNGLNIQSDFWVAYLICLIGSLGCTGVELPKGR